MSKLLGSRLYSTIFICVIAILMIIVLSFILKSANDSIIAVLSLSFTAIGAIATVATFIIAFILYDQFGLKNKFIEKQTNKVIELVDSLKGKVIMCYADHFIYPVKLSRSYFADLNELPFYQIDAKKIIIISSSDYQRGVKRLLSIGKSYWMPKSIKEKMKFLEIPGFSILEDSLKQKDYVKLEFEKNSNIDLGIPLYNTTFEEFNGDLLKLIIEIEDWLHTRSGIKIDFKMEESI